MILSFGDRATQEFYSGIGSARARRLLPPSLVFATRVKLDALNAADTLSDLRVPPGNRLERLRGELEGMHSIRINRQWRIIFAWTKRGAEDVQIVDYH